LELIKTRLNISQLKYIFLLLSLLYFVVGCKSRKAITKVSDKTLPKSIKKDFAARLGVSESDIINEQLYQFINEWYGVAYKYGGKDKSGIDCSGLTSALYLDVYKKKISANTKALVEEVKKIKESELKEGDLVFFNTNEKSISHVGVYLQNNKFVHSSTKKGVMISDMNEPYFKQTYVRSGRVN